MTAGEPPIDRQAAALLAPAAMISAVLLASAPTGFPGMSAPIAACTGLIIAIGRRTWSTATAALLVGLVAIRGAEGSDAAIWLCAVALVAAVLTGQRPAGLRGRGILFWPLMLVSTAIAVAVEIRLRGTVTGTCAGVAGAVIAGIAGFAMTMKLTEVRPDIEGVTGGDRLVPVTRPLLLGRIADSMVHELSQSLNVITMANGNLGFILDRLKIKEEDKQQAASRIQRIAAHCEKASQIITHFKWFGQDDGRDKGMMTIGTALDRAIEATLTDYRPSGIVIETRGDALDVPALRRHGTIEMVVVTLLLDMLRVARGYPDDGRVFGPIMLDAVQTPDDILISLSCEMATHDAAPKLNGIDSVTLWLAGELAREHGGALRRCAPGDSARRFELQFARTRI